MLEFLKDCQSKPLTIGDVKVGEKFILFPTDGDDSGHGRFRGGGRLVTRITPRPPAPRPGITYHKDLLITCKTSTGEELEWPLHMPVLVVHEY